MVVNNDDAFKPDDESYHQPRDGGKVVSSYRGEHEGRAGYDTVSNGAEEEEAWIDVPPTRVIRFRPFRKRVRPAMRFVLSPPMSAQDAEEEEVDTVSDPESGDGHVGGTERRKSVDVERGDGSNVMGGEWSRSGSTVSCGGASAAAARRSVSPRTHWGDYASVVPLYTPAELANTSAKLHGYTAIKSSAAVVSILAVLYVVFNSSFPIFSLTTSSFLINDADVGNAMVSTLVIVQVGIVVLGLLVVAAAREAVRVFKRRRSSKHPRGRGLLANGTTEPEGEAPPVRRGQVPARVVHHDGSHAADAVINVVSSKEQAPEDEGTSANGVRELVRCQSCATVAAWCPVSDFHDGRMCNVMKCSACGELGRKSWWLSPPFWYDARSKFRYLFWPSFALTVSIVSTNLGVWLAASAVVHEVIKATGLIFVLFFAKLIGNGRQNKESTHVVKMHPNLMRLTTAFACLAALGSALAAVSTLEDTPSGQPHHSTWYHILAALINFIAAASEALHIVTLVRACNLLRDDCGLAMPPYEIAMYKLSMVLPVAFVAALIMEHSAWPTFFELLFHPDMARESLHNTLLVLLAIGVSLTGLFQVTNVALASRARAVTIALCQQWKIVPSIILATTLPLVVHSIHISSIPINGVLFGGMAVTAIGSLGYATTYMVTEYDISCVMAHFAGTRHG